MSRSIKKGPFCAPELLKRVDEMNQTGDKKVLKTWSRASTIFPSFVGHTFALKVGPQIVIVLHNKNTLPVPAGHCWKGHTLEE